MSDETIEEILGRTAEGAAAFMRGLALDPRLPDDMRQAIASKVKEVEEAVEEALM